MGATKACGCASGCAGDMRLSGEGCCEGCITGWGMDVGGLALPGPWCTGGVCREGARGSDGGVLTGREASVGVTERGLLGGVLGGGACGCDGGSGCSVLMESSVASGGAV